MEDPSHPVNEESNAVGNTDSPGESTSAGVGEEGVKPVESFGPVANPVKVGDVAVSTAVYIDVYDVP
mgnify:CR=1 FL=1